MADYTLTGSTTDGQEEALSDVVAKSNAARAAQNPPLAPQSNLEYLTDLLFVRAIPSYENRFIDEGVKEELARGDLTKRREILAEARRRRG